MEESMKISNYIEIDVLQRILENISRATGIAFVVVDLKGNPVSDYVYFTRFCNYMRCIDEYKEICYQCDAHGGLQANIKGQPHIYKCHAGLVDFAVPIMVNENYLGAILAGQVKIKGDKEKSLSTIINGNVNLKNNKELMDAFSEITEVPYSKVVATANTIHEIANYIVEREYINTVKKALHENQLKLMEEEKVRNELESSLKDAELKALYYQINPHFLFNALNTICRLAYIEKASRTEEIAFSFSEMMRYILNKNNSEIVTVKDELSHCRNYLKIQKIRLGERLNYNIKFPEKYYSVLCPFMILQPIIENCVKYVAEVKLEGGNIDINAHDDGKDLFIDIQDDGDGIPKEKIQSLLNIKMHNENKESIGIYNVNKRLIYLLGEEYGLQIISSNRPKEGTLVRIKLQLN